MPKIRVDFSKIPEFVYTAPDVAWDAIELGKRLASAMSYPDDDDWGDSSVLDSVMEEIHEFEDAHPEYSDYFTFVGCKAAQLR